MIFSRKTILVVGAALLAACGDKVTVQEYSPPATIAKVNFVEVTPATATVSTGASITFTAAVNADAGLATTVTWTASAGTVTTAGVFTAPATANPGISVCATSTVDTGKKGCATVVVTAAAVAIPASISIQSITQTGNLNQTVDPANVIGNIDIRLNVNPGNQTVSKIVLLVGGIRQDSQTFTAAQSAALRYAADEAVAAQSTFPQVVFSVNTAAFTASTGVVRYANGAKAIAAQLFTTQGGATSAATATAQSNLTFNNPDRLSASVTPVGSFTTATSILGYMWTKIPDSLDVQILPVVYSGRAASFIAMRPVCGDSVWTKVAPPFKVRYGVPAAGYATTNSAGACSATVQVDGETPVFVSAIMADGNAAPALAFDAAAIASLTRRYDNQGPTTLPGIRRATGVGVSATKIRRFAGWLNDAVNLAGIEVTSGTSTTEGTSGGVTFKGSFISARGSDATGVSAGAASTDAQAVTHKTFVGADLTLALASAPVTSTTGIAENAAMTLCVVVRAYDALGNASAAPTSCLYNAVTNTSAGQFGLDRTAPSYARFPGADTLNTGVGTGYNRLPTDSLLDQSAAVNSARFVVFAGDTATGGTLGRSGMLGVRYTITRQNGALSQCVYGVLTSTACTVGGDGLVGGVQAAGAPAAADDFATAVINTQGFYTVAATAYDAAGNSTAVGTRSGYYDTVAPLAVGVIVNTPAQIGSNAGLLVDNLDAIDLGYMYLYQAYSDGAAATINWRCSRTDLKTTFGAAFIVADNRSVSACAIPAGVIVKGGATNGLSDPTAANAIFPVTANGITVNTFDYVGLNVGAAAIVGGNTIGTLPTAAAILAAVDPLVAALQVGRCAAPGQYALAGYCTFTISSDLTTLFTGAGILAASTANLAATVIVHDSILKPTVPPVAFPDSTLAMVKTAALTASINRSASPFTAITFLANDGQTDIPIAAGGATQTAQTIDSVTSPLYYRVSTTWQSTAQFTPGATFGIWSPILKTTTNITTAGVVLPLRAVARYARNSAATVNTNLGVAAMFGVANNSVTNPITGGTAIRTNVLSNTVNLTIKK